VDLVLDHCLLCDYGNYMKARLIGIGNSRGIRIPQQMLRLYKLEEGCMLELEERRDGILIHPQPSVQNKVSWEVAYQEMAAESAENAGWAEWDAVAGDGHDD
jgi:antitoxin component of MazEF toxin-antitoxin module